MASFLSFDRKDDTFISRTSFSSAQAGESQYAGFMSVYSIIVQCVHYCTICTLVYSAHELT